MATKQVGEKVSATITSNKERAKTSASTVHDRSDGRKNVHPKCPNASNPYHTTCTETCTQKINDMAKNQNEKKLSVAIAGAEIVRSQCKYTANPYHRCTETCIRSLNVERKKDEQEISVAAIEGANKEKHMNKEANDVASKNLYVSDTKTLNSSQNSFDDMNSGKDSSEEASSVEKDIEDDLSHGGYALAPNSANKSAVDDSFTKQYQPNEGKNHVHPHCLASSDVHNNSTGEEKSEVDAKRSRSSKYSYREFFPRDEANSAENSFLKIDIQAYILLYLAVIMTAIIAAGPCK